MTQDGLISSALLDDIYAAALGEHDWDVALRRLRNMADVRLVTLLSFQHSSQLASVNAGVGDDDAWAKECQQSYNSAFYLHDPSASVIGNWSAGRWYEDTAWLSDKYRSRHVFYQEFMRPNRIDGISGLFVHRGNGDSAFLSFLRPAGSRKLSDQQRFEVDAIASHISRSLRIQARLQQLEMRLSIAESSLDSLPTPVFILDDARNLIYANAAAHQLIVDEPALRFQHGQFLPNTHSDDAQWQKACAEGEILLHRASGQPLPMALIPVPECSRLMRSQHRRLVLMTTTDIQSPEKKAQRLRAFFGLTAAEADLAILLSCDGLSPQECADMRGVLIATVRSQIKSIYTKMGVSRTAQLSQIVFRL